jgi:hypothetical protein
MRHDRNIAAPLRHDRDTEVRHDRDIEVLGT